MVKYYSDVTKQFYKSEQEVVDAELAVKKKEAEEKKKVDRAAKQVAELEKQIADIDKNMEVATSDKCTKIKELTEAYEALMDSYIDQKEALKKKLQEQKGLAGMSSDQSEEPKKKITCLADIIKELFDNI